MYVYKKKNQKYKIKTTQQHKEHEWMENYTK